MVIAVDGKVTINGKFYATGPWYYRLTQKYLVMLVAHQPSSALRKYLRLFGA